MMKYFPDFPSDQDYETCVFISLIFNIVPEVPINEMWLSRQIKRQKIGKEEIKHIYLQNT